MRGVWLVIIILSACISSFCQPRHIEESLQKDIERLFGRLNHSLKANQDYLIIPIEGCGKCVDECVLFSKQYIQSNQITFVVSSTMGKKPITVRYPQHETLSNLLIDSKGVVSNDVLIQNRIGYLKVRGSRIEAFRVIAPREVQVFLGTLQRRLRK